METILLISLVAFIAAAVSAVVGFGGAIILLPALIAAFGARDAIVVLTVAQLVGNGSRVWFNRADIVLPVVKWFAVGAVPMAILGGVLLASVPIDLLTRLLGLFLLFSVAWRHVRAREPAKPPVERFAIVGGVFGFLSALIGSVGPLMAPFFLAYGLVKATYIGTEALATVVMHVTKLATYGGTGILTSTTALNGIALAPAMVFGSWSGKKVLDRLPEQVFVYLIEAVLLFAGCLFLIRGG
ncbi:MAG: sulfite exporter TauE/SafE family protein [Thermoleophilaceae bacterium]|nr:sulfite exporter TauE/SafE family protein [Thermoleophilaceae bacterium]